MRETTRIPARETVYRGHLFRSSLEATWAAFFDRLGWPWVYEPYEFAGYIPDFALTFKPCPVLVEVKPALTVADFTPHCAKVSKALAPWFAQGREAIFVGANWSIDGPYGPALGELLGQGGDGALWMGVGCFGGAQQDYGCRVHGRLEADGADHHHTGGCGIDPQSHEGGEISALWGDAKRATRWVPGSAKPKRDGPPPFREDLSPRVTPTEEARSLTFFGDLLAQLKAKPTP